MNLTSVLITLGLLVLVVGILLFGYYSGEDSLVGGMKSSINNFLQRFLPGDISFGDSKIAIPLNHQQIVRNLESTIKRMMASSEKNCFAKYGGFPELGEDGMALSMVYDSERKKTRFLVYAQGGEQLIEELTFTIDEMKPCVIAGNKAVTKNFVESFINDKDWADKSIDANHFNYVPEITIKEYDRWYTVSRNRINFGNEFKNFFDNGYIYTPDNKHICFFPTHTTKDFHEDGIWQDYLKSESRAVKKEFLIPSQINAGKLKTC